MAIELSKYVIDAIADAVVKKMQESVLEKIMAEIDRQEKWLMAAGYTAYNVDIAFSAIKSVVTESDDTK